MSKGNDLADWLGLERKQALYSDWGNFYAAITDYPCILFDRAGFVIISSPSELPDLGIKVEKRTNVPGLINTLPSYRLISEWRVALPEEVAEPTAPTTYPEGAVEKVTVNRYERNRAARRLCIAHHGTACSVCGLKLSDIYGAVANGFVHVHHLTQLSDVDAEYQLDPVKDLRPLCPNCHAVVHLRKEPYTLVEMKALLKPQ